MPELPEVETVRRGLKSRVLGRRLGPIEVRHPSVIVGSAEDFAARLSGCTVVGFRRKGKALGIELQPADGGARRFLLVRLGMTGQLTVARHDAPLPPHTHVVLALEGGDGEELRYRDPRRFGRLRCCNAQELDAILSQLGPDAPEITLAQFRAAMQGCRGALKTWLLNQQRLAGLGNIYADEALFEAGIHPLTQPHRLSDEAVRRLHRAVKRVLKRAIELQGTSFRDYIDIEGRPGNFRPRLRVYGRAGEPCHRCGRQIQRLMIGGRSSHFCPACQPRRVRVSLRGRKPAGRGERLAS